MADWENLRPHKIHLAVLVVIALILGAILYFTPRHAFRSNFSNLNTQEDFRVITCTVTAVSGLSIRNQPSRNGRLLTTAPYSAKLTIISQEVTEDNINGKKGYWYKVQYQGTTGFAWGNFLDCN